MAGNEFITARFPEAEVPKVQERREMLDRTRAFIKDRARIREAGGEFGPWREQRSMLDVVRRRVDRMGVGPKLIIQRENDMEQLSIREVEAVPDVPDLGTHPGIEAIHAAIWDNFPVRSGGRFLCRFIDGTQTVSRHGYVGSDWKGAAEDVFGTGELNNPQGLEDIARFVIARTEAKVLEAATVIWLQRIWTPSGERAYSGNWHGHVHVDCLGGVPCKP